MCDHAISIKRKFGAAEDGRTGCLPEDHGHFPFHKYLVLIAGNGRNIHFQFFASLREAIAHLNEGFLTFHFLNGILKHNFLGIVRKNVRPIWFPVCIVRP